MQKCLKSSKYYKLLDFKKIWGYNIYCDTVWDDLQVQEFTRFKNTIAAVLHFGTIYKCQGSPRDLAGICQWSVKDLPEIFQGSGRVKNAISVNWRDLELMRVRISIYAILFCIQIYYIEEFIIFQFRLDWITSWIWSYYTCHEKHFTKR